METCGDKIDKLTDVDWQDIVEKYNLSIHYDTLRKACQTPFGGVFAKRYFENKDNNENDMAKLRKLEKAKIQYRDERNEWQKQNRIEARVEQKLDCLEEVIGKMSKVNFPTHEYPKILSDNDLLICISDLHIGSTFDNVFGKYDTSIAKSRLEKYLQEIICIQKRHNSKSAYVTLLGDEISGNIHKTIQITNRENVIEQVKIVSELLTSFCNELSNYFERVFITSVSGNHSRVDRKEDALKDERLDDLVTFIMKKSLNNVENIVFLSHRNLDTGIVDLCIRNKTYFAVHGDNDYTTEAGVMRLCSMIGIFPEGIIMGHRHTPAFSDVNGIKIIQSGCLCGSGDDYTISKRLSGQASQTVCVCNDKGIECMYPIKL